MTGFSGQKIEGVCLLEGFKNSDNRGHFGRLFEKGTAGVTNFIVEQVNFSFTSEKGTIRGLHFQTGLAVESKVVCCIRGSVYDVVVDIRTGSSTFLQWTAVELSENGPRSLLIPRGCAHGFQTLEPNTELVYLHDNKYEPNSEQGFHYLNPQTAIDWPLEVTNISIRDSELPNIPDTFVGLQS